MIVQYEFSILEPNFFYEFCHNIRRHYTAFNNLLFFKCQGFFDIKVIPSFIPLTAERRLIVLEVVNVKLFKLILFSNVIFKSMKVLMT